MKTTLLLSTAALVTLFACNGAKEATADTPPPAPPTTPQVGTVPLYGGTAKADSLFFSLERTPCFGTCKAYRIDVYRSGFATYDGRSNMEKQGRHTTRIDDEVLAQLLAKANDIGFWTMQDKYDAEVTDLPSTYIRVVAAGKDKKVLARVGTPAAFKAFATYAEERLLPLPWKPVVAEP